MPWDPLSRGGSWTATFDQEIRDRFQFFKRLIAIDAEIRGALIAGRGSITGQLIIGDEDGNHMLVDPQTYLNTINFYHTGNASANDNRDQPGSIVSVANVGEAAIEITPPYDDGNLKRVAVNISDITQSTGVTISDKYGANSPYGFVTSVHSFTTSTVPLLVTAGSATTGPIQRWRHGASPRIVGEMREYGLYTDYSHNDLPRPWYVDVGNRTNSGTGSYETLPTIFNKDVGTDNVSIVAIACGYFQNSASTTGRDGLVQLEISIDGGSTWSSGNPIRGDHLSTAGNERIPFTAMHGLEDQTPTGNVQVRVRFQAIVSTEITVQEVGLKVDIVGDI